MISIFKSCCVVHAGIAEMPVIEHGRAPQQSHLGTATGGQVKRRKKQIFNHPAFAHRKSGTKRSIGIPDMVRPVKTLTEHAMFVELLPTFIKGSRVEWYAMACEWNLRVLYLHKLQKPLDASLEHEKRLQEFASAYVQATRSKESMMTFDFPQAMQPLDSNMPTVTQPASGPFVVADGADWHPAAQPHADGTIRHIDYSHHPPSPKRICRAGVRRG